MGCLSGKFGDVVLVEQFEAHGVADRFATGLHAGVAVSDTRDGEAGFDLVVTGKQPVAVCDLDATAYVAITDRYLRDGTADAARSVVRQVQQFDLALLRYGVWVDRDRAW